MHDLPSSVLGKKLKCGEYAYIEFLALLGTGASGAVYKVRRTVLAAGKSGSRDDLLAAKVIDVRQLNLSHRWDREREKLRREVKILASLCHSGVVNLHGVIDTNDWLVLLMDLVEGGELFNKVSNGPLEEEQARYIFKQVVETLGFLHSASVIHRDLKLENILVDAEPAPGYYQVKVADFGLSKAISSNMTVARSYVGTPQYWAPEVIMAGRTSTCSYSFEADLWSLGCLLYIMVSGRYPFDCEYDREQQILDGEYDDAEIGNVSPECQQIIKNLLVIDPARRLTIAEIKRSAWFSKPTAVPLPPLEKMQRPQIHMNVGPLFIGASASSFEVELIPTTAEAVAPPAAAPPATDGGNDSPTDTTKSSSGPAEAGSTGPPRADSRRQEEYRASVRQLFNATDMLELLVSVFYRFHQACVVFRTNSAVAAGIQNLLVDIKELTLSTRTVFQSIGLTCGTVIELLEDVRLCVEEGKPEAAVEMFDNLQSWVKDVLSQGEHMRQKYTIALERASKLVQQTRNISAAEGGSMSLLQLTLDERTAGVLENEILVARPAAAANPRRDFLDASAEPQDVLDFLFVPNGSDAAELPAINAVELPATASMSDGTRPPAAPPVACRDLAVKPACAAELPPPPTYARQTALLVRGLKELQRVANMLEEMTLYWDNLSVALSLVQKFKDQTSVLLRHASGSKRQELRLLQRVSEYEAFWDELAKQTSTFVEGSRRSGESMRKFVNTFNESIVRTNALAEYYASQQRQRQLL